MKAGRALLLLGLAAAGLGACTYGSPYEVIGHKGQVLLTTEREWRWFLVPHRPPLTLTQIDVWSGDRWIWRIKARPGQRLRLPLRYGDVPSSGVQLVAPVPLRTGEVYQIDFDDGWTNNFRVEPDGEVSMAVAPYSPDPELRAEERRAKRRVAELMATGLSEAEARRAFAEEQRLGVRY